MALSLSCGACFLLVPVAERVFVSLVLRFSPHQGHVSWRPLSLESELGEGWFLVNVVASVNDQVFVFGHVGAFVAAGSIHLDDEGFVAPCGLEECDAPDAALPFAPAYGFHVDVADVVCNP